MRILFIPAKVSGGGLLYNFAALEDVRNLAPDGFRVANLEDIVNLVNYLGGEGEAGGELKETGTENWTEPNTEATNSKGFLALPEGSRDELGAFAGKLLNSKIWIDNR